MKTIEKSEYKKEKTSIQKEITIEPNKSENIVYNRENYEKIKSGEIKLSAEQKEVMDFLEMVSNGVDNKELSKNPCFKEIMSRTRTSLDKETKEGESYYALSDEGDFKLYTKERSIKTIVRNGVKYLFKIILRLCLFLIVIAIINHN